MLMSPVADTSCVVSKEIDLLAQSVLLLIVVMSGLGKSDKSGGYKLLHSTPIAEQTATKAMMQLSVPSVVSSLKALLKDDIRSADD